MKRLLILLLSTPLIVLGTIAAAQIGRNVKTYDVPPIVENQSVPAAKHWASTFFQCTDDAPQFSSMSTVVEGEPAENLYRTHLATTCAPKPHMGFTKGLAVVPMGTSTDPLKYKFTGVIDTMLQLSPENIDGDPQGYTAQALPYGTLYHVHIDKQTCDEKGCHYKVRIASTLKIETDGISRLTIADISDSITPQGTGVDKIVASHLKGISYAMTITPSSAGYVIHYESSSLIDQGDNPLTQWIFKRKRATLDSQTIERFDATVQTGLNNFIALYSSAHPDEFSQILALAQINPDQTPQ